MTKMLRLTADQFTARQLRMLERSKEIGPVKLTLTPYVPTEAQVQASIVEAITKLRLGQCVRYNSGGMYNTAEQFIRFNSAKGHSDLAGVLNGGRAYYLEIKRPGWKGPKDDREHDQAAFLDRMRAAGAIAEFVTSVDAALAALGVGPTLFPVRMEAA